jgi:Holliday junction resolvasome RuvABC endonuclease subunit
LTAFIEVTNLINRVNDCCVEYQLEEEELEEVFLDVEATSSIEIVPSIGVVWKF